MRLSVLQYGDPILRAKGKPIEEVDDRVCELAMNMVETMHAANGVGLAAQQIGEALQLTVLDVSQVEDRPSTMKLNGQTVEPKTAMPLILINPELTLSQETTTGTEGCLVAQTTICPVVSVVPVGSQQGTRTGPLAGHSCTCGCPRP